MTDASLAATRRASALLLIGGAVAVLVATLLPWTVFDTVLGSTSRTIYQLGANRRLDWTPLPVVLLAGCGVALGLERLGVLRTGEWIERSPLLLAAVLIGVVLFSWPGSWRVPSGVTIVRGDGGYLALFGAAAIGLAGLIEHQNAPPK